MLLVAILAQLALLAYQVKTSQDVRLIRVWAVSAVTPLARALEAGRSGTSHFLHNYFMLIGVREDYRRVKAELDQAQMDEQYLRAQLATAENAKALSIFQATSQSKTLAAHDIGNTTVPPAPRSSLSIAARRTAFKKDWRSERHRGS